MPHKLVSRETLKKNDQNFIRYILEDNDLRNSLEDIFTSVEVKYNERGAMYVAGGYAVAKFLNGAYYQNLATPGILKKAIKSIGYGDIDVYLVGSEGPATQAADNNIQLIRRNPATRITRPNCTKHIQTDLQRALAEAPTSFEDHVLTTLSTYDLVLSQVAMTTVNNFVVIYVSESFISDCECDAITRSYMFEHHMNDVYQQWSKHPEQVHKALIQHIGITVGRLDKYEQRFGNFNLYAKSKMPMYLEMVRDSKAMAIVDDTTSDFKTLPANASYAKSWARLNKSLFIKYGVSVD